MYRKALLLRHANSLSVAEKTEKLAQLPLEGKGWLAFLSPSPLILDLQLLDNKQGL